MKTMFNRFAIIPHMCSDCHRYFWLEKYRKAECWEKCADRFIKKRLCNECIKKYK